MKQPPIHTTATDRLSEAHAEQWDERLQDWLDGELNEVESAAFDAHLATCSLCQDSLAALEKLDAGLVEATPPLHLDARFDQALWARIGTIDETRRAEARRRIELEMHQQMQDLARNWRRTLAFVIPGVVAGMALVFALTSWLDGSGLANTLIAEGAAELGGGSADFLRIGITAVVGSALGMLVAPWLARLGD